MAVAAPTRRRKRKPQPGTLRRMAISDYADFELLHVIEDHSGESTISLAEFLEAEPRAVGTRLSWMTRMGLTMRDSEGGWVLARRGHALLNGRSEGLMEIRRLSKTAGRDPVMNWVARREWNRNL